MACLASVVITHMCPDSSGIGALPWVLVRSLALNVELAAGVLTLVDLIGRCVCVRIVNQPPSGSTRPRDGGSTGSPEATIDSCIRPAARDAESKTALALWGDRGSRSSTFGPYPELDRTKYLGITHVGATSLTA